MADFREVLEISRNECKNFLHYDWYKTKHDLADENWEENPIDIDYGFDESIGTIANMVDDFCGSTAVARAKLRSLLETGNQRCRIIVEY